MPVSPRAMIKTLPDAVFTVSRVLRTAGFESYLVGGAVRSLAMGLKPADFDFATSARPEDVMTLFHRVVPTGVKHGTVTVLMQGRSFEVTTYRVDRTYSDRRRPDSVEFTSDIVEDLSRRDFTINAMALGVLDATLLDPYGGKTDLEHRTIRAIGEPRERFCEDALRILRAIRFSAQLEFELEKGTQQAMQDLAGSIDAVSAERVRDELLKMLAAERPSIGLFLMRDTGLLPHILPELNEGVGVEQRGMHAHDVFTHSVLACDAAPAENMVVRLAALLHDVGKPRCLTVDPDGERRFNGHDLVSSEMTAAVLRRLRVPIATERAVTHLVRQHMFAYTPEWSDAAVRRFIARVGREWIDTLLALRTADSQAVRGSVNTAGIEAFRLRITDVLSRDHALGIKDLAVDGNELAQAGVPKGPAMGTVLEFLLETVLEDPSLNERDRLLEIGARFYAERVAPGR